jgi:hypothetical protein
VDRRPTLVHFSSGQPEPFLTLNTSPNRLKLSVVVTSHAYLLEIQGLFTQGSRPGRTLGESVGGISEMESSDWSNGIRYHTFDARSNTEFNTPSFPAFNIPCTPPKFPLYTTKSAYVELTGGRV